MPARIILTVFMIALIPGWNSWAQERNPMGEVLVGSALVDVTGNKAKFNEYRDLRDGLGGGIDLRLDGERTYFELRGGEIGYRDQSLDLHGGSRGGFGFELSYQEIPHNFSSGSAVHR